VEGGEFLNSNATLCFDTKKDCWYVEEEGDRFDLHCGYSFQLSIGGVPMPCSIELDSDWYIIMKGVRFYLRKKDKYFIWEY